MKKTKILETVVTVLSILIAGCGGCNNEKVVVKPANIIVLLDLSDRVSVEKYEEREYKERVKEQVNDDKDNCRTIIEVFNDIVRKEPYSNSKSKLQFFVPEQQGFPIDSELKRELRVFEEIPIRNFSRFGNLQGEVTKTIDQLYGQVLTTPDANFTGADIWSWFKYEAKRYLDPKSRNYIICLSDGYLDFDKEIQDKRKKGTFIVINEELRESDDWENKVRNEYKLLTPSEADFSLYEVPVKFLMLGIKDRIQDGSLRDRDILNAYWIPWLASMGIESSGLHPSDFGKGEIASFLEAPQ